MTPDDLRPYVERYGPTNQQFAAKFGVRRETVARWLAGETPIPLMLQWALAAADAGLKPVQKEQQAMSDDITQADRPTTDAVRKNINRLMDACKRHGHTHGAFGNEAMGSAEACILEYIEGAEREISQTRSRLERVEVALRGLMHLYDDVDEGDKTAPEFVAACAALAGGVE